MCEVGYTGMDCESTLGSPHYAFFFDNLLVVNIRRESFTRWLVPTSARARV